MRDYYGVIMAKRRTTKRADHGLIPKANKVLKRSKVPPPGQYRVAAVTAPPNWAEMVAKDPEGPEIQAFLNECLRNIVAADGGSPAGAIPRKRKASVPVAKKRRRND
jgi:hypothetical protein